MGPAAPYHSLLSLALLLYFSVWNPSHRIRSVVTTRLREEEVIAWRVWFQPLVELVRL